MIKIIKTNKFIKSLRHALNGLFTAAASERNFRIMIVLVLVSTIVSVWLPLKFWQWTVIVVAGAMMLIIELVNTVMEKTMDLVLPASLEEIRDIKNIMAAAALIASISWLAVIILVFLSVFSLQ